MSLFFYQVTAYNTITREDIDEDFETEGKEVLDVAIAMQKKYFEQAPAVIILTNKLPYVKDLEYALPKVIQYASVWCSGCGSTTKRCCCNTDDMGRAT